MHPSTRRCLVAASQLKGAKDAVVGKTEEAYDSAADKARRLPQHAVVHPRAVCSELGCCTASPVSKQRR